MIHKAESQRWYWVPGSGVKYEYPSETPAGAVEMAEDVVYAIADYVQGQVAYHIAEARAWDRGDRNLTSPEVARIATGAASVDLGANEVGTGASPPPKDTGKTAHDAYCQIYPYLTPWERLAESDKAAWRAVATAVADTILPPKGGDSDA